MECYHGVVSINHGIKGSLKVNNKEVDFNDGKGYIEKDWGASFPKAWVWMQSNHFKDYGTSVIASIAKIPWLTGEFTGFIIGILYNERLQSRINVRLYERSKRRKELILEDMGQNTGMEITKGNLLTRGN